jgi:hypothetical protein
MFQSRFKALAGPDAAGRIFDFSGWVDTKILKNISFIGFCCGNN